MTDDAIPTGEATGRGRIEEPDLSEKGGRRNGEVQRSDDRLFMQLMVFTGCADARMAGHALQEAGIDGVLYEDLNDPLGVALLTLSQDPDHFLDGVRPFLHQPPFSGFALRPELTMFGRTYALGYEPDLPDVLIHRPRRTVLNRDWRWAIWYPLRRNGQFEQLPPEEQRKILAEHGSIGKAYGAADYVHDIRLACHGLDSADNDFVVGLVGKALFPLSALVQRMRRTQQTSLYLDRLGPFFIGRVVWQSP